MKWPGNHYRPLSIGSTVFIQQQLQHQATVILGNSLASAVWPSANRAIFIPFEVEHPYLVTQMYTFNGTAAAGNIDLGVYSEDGTRIVSTGSTAQSGTTTYQIVDVTDTMIGRGCFYMALALSSASGTNSRFTSATTITGLASGMMIQDTAFALPATATFAATTSTYFPVFGLTGYSVV